ncbi:MAG TPA: hypothetical protein VMA75_04105 [Candidatus Paceibacterota bacterium]|nr:hypothetical protein [Candidatus Paceibacterota bacterium]
MKDEWKLQRRRRYAIITSGSFSTSCTEERCMKRTIAVLILAPLFGANTLPAFSQSTISAPSAEEPSSLVISRHPSDPIDKNDWMASRFSDGHALRDRQTDLGQRLQEKFLKTPGFLRFATRSRELKWLSRHCCDIESDAPDPPRWESGPPPSRRVSPRHHHPR